MRRIYTSCLLFFIFPLLAFSQNNFWTPIEESSIQETGERVIVAKSYALFELDLTGIKDLLAQAPMERTPEAGNNTVLLDIPMPDGSMLTFKMVESPIMARGLAERYPEIKTYAGEGINDKYASVRLDVTPKGFHAMAFTAKGTVFIDPFYRSSVTIYQSYFKKDFTTDKVFACELLDDDLTPVNPLVKSGGTPSVGDELRIYRLAVSATGEYTQYHGGTVMDGLSAIVITMNRVNGVYIRDFSVRMELIPNNDQVVYTNPATDPFGSGSDLANNQNSLDATIGTANYDIGHVFDFGDGGVASLGSVCNAGSKGRGYTSGNPPEFDPFDIDYVSHEMGHQFAGNHTFNYCGGGQGPVPTEPGSATTIMGYAGICGADNLQPNSNDHFHTVNFDETYQFTVLDNGNSCAQIIATGNTPPVADAGEDGYFIPISTPFELEGNGFDADGDELSYCWEGMDMGPATPPFNPSGETAIFRSFAPTMDPVRVFPRIEDVVNNTSTIGEILPTYTRELNFRLTVRDNNINGGGSNYDDFQMDATELAGPFLVTSPNTSSVEWNVGSIVEVEWDVANTDNAPVNCQNVNIFLSTDGGFTYPITLATEVPNTGSAFITVPNAIGTQNRVKVKGAGNVFFDISNQNFTIADALEPGIQLLAVDPSLGACVTGQAVFEIVINGVGGFDEQVNLSVTGVPTPMVAEFSTNDVTPPATVLLTVSNLFFSPAGNYPLEITATSMNNNSTVDVALQTFSSADISATDAPAMGESDVSLIPTFSWTGSLINIEYTELQIATDPAFSNVIYTEQVVGASDLDLPHGVLEGNATYYWRVRGFNSGCGNSFWTDGGSFTTEGLNCITYSATDLPKQISADEAAVIFSRIPVFQGFEMADVNVLDLDVDHTSIAQLTIQLIPPSQDTVILVEQGCNTFLTSIETSFDDESPNDWSCPIPPGQLDVHYTPTENLDQLEGQFSSGFWTLQVVDNVANAGGSFNSWTLEICESLSISVEDLVEEETLRVFPNPATDLVTFESRFLSEELTEVNIINTLGQVVYRQKNLIFNRENHLTVDASEWVNGVYLYLVSTNSGKMWTGKLTINK